MICCANQLIGFYMRATLALNGLNKMWLVVNKKANSSHDLFFSVQRYSSFTNSTEEPKSVTPNLTNSPATPNAH